MHFRTLTAALSVLILSGTAANAQDDRENASLPIIADKSIWTLDQATGWMKNAEGQWIEGKNKIQDNNSSVSNKAAWNEGQNAVGMDNFIKYEVRDIKIGGIDFLLFVKIMNDGYFKYELSKGGWTPITRAHYIVFKKGQVQTSESPGDKTATAYETQCYFKGTALYTPSYLNAIALQLSKDDQLEPRYKTLGTDIMLLINYKELSDKTKCRFELYANNVKDEKFDMRSQKVRSNRDSYLFPFQDYYYECPKEKFEGLIKLVSK